MHTVFALCLVLLVGLLLFVAAIVPRRSPLSRYELNRRASTGDSDAVAEHMREDTLRDLQAAQTAVCAVLIVIITLLAIGVFGWAIGAGVAVVVSLCYSRVSALTVVRRIARKFYLPQEKAIVAFMQRHSVISRALGRAADTKDVLLNSREELEHIVDQSGRLLSSEEKTLITNGLRFGDKTVESIMTPRSVVATIAHNEIIGPLVLDDLHRTGHSRFPVIDGDIDHVVGVLHIRELLGLTDKTSQTVADAMEKKVYYVHENQTLEEALAAFLKTRHHLFIVVNAYRETVGVLTLEDVIEALLGRKIIDEFDVHDDLRIVAIRDAKLHNNAADSTDL